MERVQVGDDKGLCFGIDDIAVSVFVDFLVYFLTITESESEGI